MSFEFTPISSQQMALPFLEGFTALETWRVTFVGMALGRIERSAEGFSALSPRGYPLMDAEGGRLHFSDLLNPARALLSRFDRERRKAKPAEGAPP